MKDLQNLDSNNATERWLRYVGPDGQRQDAAHRYLHPKLQSGDYPNLHVLVEHQVVRVLFDDNKKATGVEFEPNAKLKGSGGSKRTVGAKKLVVLSAGANATPLILERSGIGNPEVLKRAGVSVVEALPDIGEHYQDHHLTLYAYRTSLGPRETINGFDDGRFGMNDIQEMIKNKDELLGWNSMDASGKFRPTDEEVEALGPEFKEAWDRDFKDAADRPLMIIAMYLA
jgi:alcohol oxidase